MKKYIVSFIYLIPFWVLAQDLKPFLQSPYQEFISDIIPLENDEILVTNFITAIDLSTYNYLNNDSINGGFFSTLQVYDKNGLFIKALALPDTDTSVFWSASVIQTQDGKFCIAGQSLNTIANTSKLFFAIINADLNSIESLHILPSTNNVECNIIYEFENGNIAFLANEGGIYKIKQYQKNGTFVSEYNLDNLGCLSVNLKNLSYFHNNEIKQVCSNNISGSFISISENYLIGNYPINVIPEMNNKRVKNFSRRGTIYKNTLLFNAGAVQNPINQNDSIYPLIMQVDTNNNISVFFSDTTSSIHYNSFLYHNNVNIFDEDYIYAVFSDNRQESGAYTLYCLNAQGDIRWKKYINSSVGSLWNIDKKNILQT